MSAAPGQTHPRHADLVAVQLIDGHLGASAVNILDEAAPFAWRDLDIRDIAIGSKKTTELVLVHDTGQPADKDRCIVRVRKLVVGILLMRVGLNWGGEVAVAHTARRSGSRSTTGSICGGDIHGAEVRFWLWGRNREAHGAAATVHALEFFDRAELFALVAKADEAVATRLARGRVGHDLGRPDACIGCLECSLAYHEIKKGLGVHRREQYSM